MWGIIAILLFIIATIYTNWKARKFLPMPGPPLFPIVGSLPYNIYSRIRGYHDVTLQDIQTYGKVYKARVGGRWIIYISDTEDIKYIQVTNFANYARHKIAKELLQPMFGNGIFNTFGEDWRIQRQTASSLFHFNNLRAFVNIFKERADVLCSIVGKQSESGPVELQDLFMKYTMDSIGQLGFGIDINSLTGNEKAMAFAHGFDYVQEKTVSRIAFHPWWKWFSQEKFNGQLEAVDGFMRGIIEDRKSEIKRGVDVSGRVDLLSNFVSAKNPDGTPAFNDQYLLDILKNFLIAGRDTTAVGLTWALYNISQHPDVEQKVLKEIDDVIGRHGQITYENQSELKYMRQVLDETLRLYPSVPRTLREAIADDVLPSGYRVPANAGVSYSSYSLHRLPEYFKDPLIFNPDRWVTDTIKPFSFVPFSGGPRICLGQNLAYQEMKVALATLLQKFTFRLVKDHVMMYRLTMTLPAKNGLKMWVEERK